METRDVANMGTAMAEEVEITEVDIQKAILMVAGIVDMIC